jgi:hypothetical protein
MNRDLKSFLSFLALAGMASAANPYATFRGMSYGAAPSSFGRRRSAYTESQRGSYMPFETTDTDMDCRAVQQCSVSNSEKVSSTGTGYCHLVAVGVSAGQK